MSNRLSILQKGLILIAVPLLFQVGFIGLVVRIRWEGADAEKWTLHTKDVIADVQACRNALISAHSACQGYTLTGDPDFGAAMMRGVGLASDAIRGLIALVSDNSPQVRSGSSIRVKIDDFLAYLSDGTSLVREGKMTPALAAARRRQSQAYLDEIDRDLERFLNVEKGLEVGRDDRLRRSWAALDTLLTGGLVISVGFTVAMALLFGRNISGRIGALTANAVRLAEGRELTPPVGGDDEIAGLDRVFHEMAETLAEAAARERLHASLLERRAEEMEAINAQLREKAQENEMFVYSVSHDLRSPLVNLQGFSRELAFIGKDLVKLLERDDVPPEVGRQGKALVDREMAESIRFIQTAVSRLSAIIDALLRLSRAGRVEYREQVVEVDAVVARVIAAYRGTIDERKAIVEVDRLPSAWGDPTAIEQVFANLVGNALNYLDPARPGRIRIYRAGPERTSVEADESLAVFAVEDNGLGIAESYRSKVFAIFQRLHGDVAKGEGVGLALVKRMVERHGGRVWFESEPGRGSTFFVELKRPPDASRPGPGSPGRNGSIAEDADRPSVSINGRESSCLSKP